MYYSFHSADNKNLIRSKTEWLGFQTISEMYLDENVDSDIDDDGRSHEDKTDDEMKSIASDVNLVDMIRMYETVKRKMLKEILQMLNCFFGISYLPEGNSCKIYYDLGVNLTSLNLLLSYFFHALSCSRQAKISIKESEPMNNLNNPRSKNNGL